MKKNDFIIVAILIICIPLWLWIDANVISPKIQPAAPAVIERTAVPQTPPPVQTANVTETAAEKLPEPTEPLAEEITTVLKNNHLSLKLSSYGAGIKSATLLNYQAFIDSEEPKTTLDFSDSHALAYEGLRGISNNEPLDLQTDESGNTVTFTKVWENGTVFKRTITLSDDFMLSVTDQFINQSTSDWNVPSLHILTGRMKNPEEMQTQKGVVILGVDSFTAPKNINYWGRKLNKLYKTAGNPLSLEITPDTMRGEIVDWVAAKNKFFTQILRPTKPVATMQLRSHGEKEKKNTIPTDVAAALTLPAVVINAGERYEISYDYFVGPKKHAILQAAGNNMDVVMEFHTTGFFSGMDWLMNPARKGLLWILNICYAIIPNYGIAIILLTILVRVLFWPLTHKSTESMKRMQEIQPLVKALQEKYKKDPQRLQKETMLLYKEHKANPMGGCLPMLIQIPVFIALFTVLRNAIELRYAGFLWIPDLSAPENLFNGSIPFVGSLNILPLLMAGSMFWQQKLTPKAAATPEQMQQQQMMMYMMPVMMLFFFYKMPSGLVLYWTTSQFIMILQMSLRNRKKKTAPEKA